MKILFLTVLMAIGLNSSAENPFFMASHYSQCSSWEVAVYSFGYAHERLSDTCHTNGSYTRLHRVSANQLRMLRKVLSTTKFATLPESIEPATHLAEADFLEIKVFEGASPKSVQAEELERATNRDQAQRFQQVWKALTAIIPEPQYK